MPAKTPKKKGQRTGLAITDSWSVGRPVGRFTQADGSHPYTHGVIATPWGLVWLACTEQTFGMKIAFIWRGREYSHSDTHRTRRGIVRRAFQFAKQIAESQ